MTKVLLLDGESRKALSVVRSLGRVGYDITVASPVLYSAAAWSRYATARVSMPRASECAYYAERLERIASTGNYEIIIPLEETSIEAFFQASPVVQARAVLPPEGAYRLARDKWRTLDIAARLGVPTPKSALCGSVTGAMAAARQIGFPVILKPLSSSGSRGFCRANDIDEFARLYRRTLPRYGHPIIQEAIPWEGQGVGVGSLFHNGTERVSYSYKRLREFPVRGGPSTLRETTDDPQIRLYARQILEAISWDGLAMVEFKVDPRDGVPKLMEINPRLWGSIALADTAGINFPALLLQQRAGKVITQPQYRIGARCRWLLPGDIAHFIANPRRFRMKPSFFDFSNKDTAYDEFSADDIRGSLMTVVSTVASAFEGETWRKGVFRR